MSGARLFKRGVKISAYRSSIEAGTWFQPLPNGIEITDLRIEFEIEKSLDKQPNKGDVKITNCAPTTRAFLEKRPLIVRVDAGYDGDVGHLFTGDLRWGASKLSNVNWETRLQLADGDRAYRYAAVNRSYKKGTTVLTALRECASAMSLVLPSNLEVTPDLQRQFATGISIQGPARDELTRLLAPFGYTWSIQDGKIQILKDADPRPGVALLISKDTGLIGTPEYAAPENIKKPPTLTIRHLLYRSVTPGGLVRVKSKGTDGVFKVQRVKHHGDTHGDEWTTEIEARAA